MHFYYYYCSKVWLFRVHFCLNYFTHNPPHSTSPPFLKKKKQKNSIDVYLRQSWYLKELVSVAWVLKSWNLGSIFKVHSLFELVSLIHLPPFPILSLLQKKTTKNPTQLMYIYHVIKIHVHFKRCQFSCSYFNIVSGTPLYYHHFCNNAGKKPSWYTKE